MTAENRTRVAAIDCGTNSIRLLIADVFDEDANEDPAPVPGLRDVVREMVITRLGQDVDRTGILNPSAVERTLAVTKQYQQQIDELGATRARFVATSASRDAKNRAAFVEGVKRITGLEPEVISGIEEANLSFLGALSSVPAGLQGPYMVVDIGGGSTEFVSGSVRAADGNHRPAVHVNKSVSVDMGSVRVTERFGPEPWTKLRLESARTWIDERLEEVQRSIDLSEINTVVGVAGTVTSLGAHVAGVTEYSPLMTHGSIPTAQQWARAINFMVGAPVHEKAALGFMPPGRADVIGGGALVWERILVLLGLLRDCDDGTVEATSATWPAVIVSEHDVLDGLALSLSN